MKRKLAEVFEVFCNKLLLRLVLNKLLLCLRWPRTHRGDVRVLSIVDAKERSKLQQQLRSHCSVAMNPCNKANLGLGGVIFPWFV